MKVARPASRMSAPGTHPSINHGMQRHTETAALVRSGLATSGRPLDAMTRGFMEQRLGHDFSSVRVHTDHAAAQSAQAVGANAYSVGSHIFFNAGGFAPSTSGGRQLVAHELTHVVQQSRGSVAGSKISEDMFVSDPHDPLERQARATAARIVANGATSAEAEAPIGRLPAVSPSAEAVTLQRDTAGDVGAVAGVVGAVLALAGLGIALAAWLKPKNANATAQGISLQPNPFQFNTLGDNPAAVPDSPDAQQKFQSAAEAPPTTEPLLELRTDEDNDATFNLQYNTDGHNVISASVVPGPTQGYQGGYNGSVASVVFSETQTFPPPKGATPAPATAESTPSKGTPTANQGASAGGKTNEAPPTAQVARALIRFGGTNGKSGAPLQTFGGEALLTGDGTLRCLRAKPMNGIGYGFESGSMGVIDSRSAMQASGGSTSESIVSPTLTPSSPSNPIEDLKRALPFNKPMTGGE